jgi:hypothetical protein
MDTIRDLLQDRHIYISDIDYQTAVEINGRGHWN